MDFNLLSDSLISLLDLTILGLGGLDPTTFIKGRTGGATKEAETLNGDGAGDSVGTRLFPNKLRPLEKVGVAVGLGAEINDVPV